MTPKQPRIVFAGVARDCEPYLPAVLDNLNRFAALASQSAFIIVENDSSDCTRPRLAEWLADRPGRLINMDGLATREPERTARIAAARNAYLDAVLHSTLSSFDYLAVADFDDVNAVPIATESFACALSILAQQPQVAAVFACSAPVYYDVWALRHPTWCPNDVWEEVRAERELPVAAATERYVYSRQIRIPAGAAAIPVQSAFGGLGIYRLAAIGGARYEGVSATGAPCCEHVAFNRTVGKSGTLLILPSLRNRAPIGHLRPSPRGYVSRVLNIVRGRCLLGRARAHRQ